jgi:hypothetical protein
MSEQWRGYGCAAAGDAADDKNIVHVQEAGNHEHDTYNRDGQNHPGWGGHDGSQPISSIYKPTGHTLIESHAYVPE